MAIFKNSSLVTDIRGAMSGHVFSRSKSGPTIYKRTYRNRQKIGNQFPIRNNFSRVMMAWKSLSQAQRDTWNSTAVNNPLVNKLGEEYFESGYNLFTRLNYQRLYIDESINSDSPGSKPDLFFPSFNFTFDPSNDEFFIDLIAGLPDDTSMIFEATPMLSPGVTSAPDKLQHIAVIDDSMLPLVDLSSFYQNVYGVGISDMANDTYIIFSVRMLHVPSGYTSTRLIFDSTFIFNFDVDAQNVISRMNQVGSTLTLTEELAINTFVLNLKGMGTQGNTDIWSVLSYLRIGSLNDSSHALVEWCMKDGFGLADATLVGAPTFQSGQGYQGGVGVAVQESFVPAFAPGGLFVQDDAIIGVLELGGAINEPKFGVLDSPSSIYLNDGSFNLTAAINSILGNQTPFGFFSGWFNLSRTLSTAFDAFLDNNIIGSYAVNSSSLSMLNVFTSGANNGGIVEDAPNSIIGAFFAGNDFQADIQQLFDSYDQFMTEFNS
jgi:hypothetical protein